MPRQNTSPTDFPPAILAQIEKLAQNIVVQRKRRGETQVQWAQKLGISQPTMARIERGDPAVAMATYVSCLWQLNPAMDLTQLLPTVQQSEQTASVENTPQRRASDQAAIEQRFAKAKAALDFFKSPMF